jgi:hypothetical protein
MAAKRDNRIYWVTFIASVVFAFLGWKAPEYRMPLDYDAMITKSIPFAVAWCAALVFCLSRYRLRGLWLLLGAPMAFFWPIWLVFNRFPTCYYVRNCA